MSSVLADRTPNLRTFDLPFDLERPPEEAGPMFFAKHRVSELRRWPAERLESMGAIPFPVGYCGQSDRYETKVWGDVFLQVAYAIASCDVISVIGSSSSSSELEGVQTLLHHHTRRPVEVIECFGDTKPGCIWSSTDENQNEPDFDARRVAIALGTVPPLHELGVFSNCTALFIHEHLAPAMFALSGKAFAVPMSRGGWKLSHIAFHRLLEIGTELSCGDDYRRMFDETDSFSRPLCFIVAELLNAVHRHRSMPDFADATAYVVD
ncbi:hypothetical protein ACI2J5_23385 [Agrobacterium pusense]|uniref:hypothetical protein n=1 Tax=Agrobacterium pusense TaxID=648995 RepID=UPI000C2D0AB2|nr:hypothetical protein BLX90_24410 [Rhizobium sp. Y9]